MHMTPRDLEHEWKAYDVLLKVNSHVCDHGSCVSDSIKSPVLRFLHNALGWDILFRTYCDHENVLFAKYHGGPVGFLTNNSYQVIFSAKTLEKAVEEFEDALKRGCTAYVTFNNAEKAKWEIPPFSTLEELQMKANICGGIEQWSRPCH